ncbi:soluble lamin-associated protein of 75 kDa-like [Enoplosus armatus]|uniref:soluble lamin-associated protein of 75 kDa-like n=1 Tax=Enoplosus armatus TaxID=215367 RepID=UPI003992381B
MKFPVDLLADVSQAELERLAHNYTNNLLYSNPDSSEHLTLTDSTQVTIDISSVGFVPLYGSSDKQKILALFSPSDPFTAVALYLLDQWWAVNDILKTTDPARDGAVEVETLGERIVLYILNRVIYRAKEMSSEELPFLCHGEKDNAKILWKNGEAVGFYSVKPSGSLCKSFSTRSYQLPVMDSIFVRKCQRGKGFGLQMLEDFVLSFKENCLGLRYPLTKSMYKVCERYLCQYPGDTDLLWEVESIGGPNQRTNIANKIQAMDLSEAEVPVASRGRSSGSKQRKMGEKIAEDKSEKVIRSGSVFSVDPDEKEEDVDAAPEEDEEEATMLDKPAIALASQDLEEADVTSAPSTEEQQVEDDATQDLTSHDSQITVENVASEIEEAEEKCHKKDTAMLVISEEVLEVYKEAETVGEVTDEKSEESFTQHETKISAAQQARGGDK